ncbi:MAG: UvrB/UvrC motif-containing protein, partial [Rubripirellula sp.]
RSETSLIQTIGRAARNSNSRVILYADKVTNSMKMALDETERRRAVQQAYNQEHGITPTTVRKNIRKGIEADAAKRRENVAAAKAESDGVYITLEYVEALEQEMLLAAEELEFERAASLRDRVLQLKDNIGKPLSEIENEKPAGQGKGGRQRKGRKGVRTGSKTPRPKE